VIPIGGFSGSDPAPTLAQFKKMVADGQITYFVGGGMGGGSQPGSTGTGTGTSPGQTGTATTPGAPSGTGTQPGTTGTQPGGTTGSQPGSTTGGGNRGGFGDRGTSSSISTWVEENFTAVTVGGTTIYDLTKPKS
jgi:hypothetical protein